MKVPNLRSAYNEVGGIVYEEARLADGSSEGLAADKRAAGLAARSDIVTWFDWFDADEQRPKAQRNDSIE